MPPFAFSARAVRTVDPPISFLISLALEDPQLISLAAGLVDEQTLPAETVAELAQQVLTPPSPAARRPLQYGATAGLPALRAGLLDHLAQLDGVKPEDLDASPEDIVISTGSQQLLFLLTDVLVDPGDIVITAWPSYFVYTGLLQSLGARIRCVDMDDEGLVPQSLDHVLAELADQGLLPRVKIVYVCSYHQNPTGLTLSAERRPEILRIVQRYSMQHRILLLEDAAYRELTYDGAPLPSIKRYDTRNQTVALLQTFSKPFAPGLKTGYGLLPRDIAAAVLRQKGNHDFGSAHLCQHLLHRALDTGAFDRQLQTLRQRYAAKCRALCEALAQHLGDLAPRVTWTRPAGGLYVFLTLPAHVDTGADAPLFARAVSQGVLYVPGAYCFGPDPVRTVPRHTMRLSFGVEDEPRLREGVARLARAIRASL